MVGRDEVVGGSQFLRLKCEVGDVRGVVGWGVWVGSSLRGERTGQQGIIYCRPSQDSPPFSMCTANRAQPCPMPIMTNNTSTCRSAAAVCGSPARCFGRCPPTSDAQSGSGFGHLRHHLTALAAGGTASPPTWTWAIFLCDPRILSPTLPNAAYTSPRNLPNRSMLRCNSVHAYQDWTHPFVPRLPAPRRLLDLDRVGTGEAMRRTCRATALSVDTSPYLSLIGSDALLCLVRKSGRSQ